VTDWDPARLPDQHGRTAVVTGGNAGIGFGISRQLAAAGARVVLASRSPEKAQAAIAAIRAETPGASLGFVRLDLASLDAVRTAAAELRALGTIDVLVNNAGRTDTVRERRTTEDGIELVMGTNAFGPFALTALVAPSLADDGRVVWLGSLSTRMVRADDDLQSTASYAPFRAYGRSKHAMHAIGFELARRWTAAGSSRRSLVAHPGYAVDRRPVPPVSQLKERGAWPAVRAALDPDAASGSFWGPGGLLALTGRPALGVPVAASAEPAYGERVWAEAERATGVAFRI
jgi:NAD(P)-dependent dehydrogenase (short-subunit alcohol dehydrogenase family)